jgi:hypothetical protein
MAGTLEDLLAVERGELGYSRWDDPEPGTKYGRWYAEQTGEAWYGASGVPYCAMFQSWCLAVAGISAAGMPGAYTPYIQNGVHDAGMAHSAEDAQQGDLVLFDWDDEYENAFDGPEHIGFVEYNNGDYLTCIEGNTNDGEVARRYRPYGAVTVCWTPYYDGEGAQSSIVTDSGIVLVDDGYAGFNTIGRAQQVAGTTVDHVVSDQPWWTRSQPQARATGVWEAGDLDYGSELVRAIQTALNNKHGWGLEIDGFFGPATWGAMEENFGVGRDDRMDAPSETICRWQRCLNDGSLV